MIPRAKQIYWLIGWVQSPVVIEGVGSCRFVRKSSQGRTRRVNTAARSSLSFHDELGGAPEATRGGGRSCRQGPCGAERPLNAGRLEDINPPRSSSSCTPAARFAVALRRSTPRVGAVRPHPEFCGESVDWPLPLPLPLPRPRTFVFSPVVLVVMRLRMLPWP